jgi:hypothetical protein
VEAQLGSSELPAHVLAALASRGSAHALAVLAAHLDDGRAYVRRWVLAAIRFTLARPLAVAELKAVADRLGYADTQRGVREALEQLQKPATDDE